MNYFFVFIKLTWRYFENSTFGTCLAFQMRKDRKCKTLAKISVLDLHEKKCTLYNIFFGFFMKNWFSKLYYLLVHREIFWGKICLAHICHFWDFIACSESAFGIEKWEHSKSFGGRAYMSMSVLKAQSTSFYVITGKIRSE